MELVYITTTNAHHAEHIRLALLHGKHVICEKPFALNRAEAADVIALAREKHLLLAEAIWTRYMPSAKAICELAGSDEIGRVSALSANLFYHIANVERIGSLELGGGALLDIGVYGLNFARMAFGRDVRRISATALLRDTGIDDYVCICMEYDGKRMATVTAGTTARSDRMGILYGDKGYAVFDNINNPHRLVVYDSSDTVLREVAFEERFSGYEYQFIETVDSIRRGMLENPSMPHEETLYIMGLMDDIRRQIGVKYPQEA